MIRAQVLREFQSLLGPESVVADFDSLRAAETTTFPTSQRIPVILRPRDKSVLSQLLHLANKHGIPLYPISSGKNWGYGSRVPIVDGCAILDLSRFDRILDFNEERGYVTLEPGVTQQALYDFLQARRSKLWLDATGSSPACSVIGNAVERGFGHTPYSDHFANLCGLEIFLPDGTVVETGFSGLPNAKAGPLYKWGLGPSLDGLFSQSNFGIVTRATVWLMPAPEYTQAFVFQCAEANRLPRLIDALRPLRLNGVLRSAVHIGNDYKVIAMDHAFPDAEPKPLQRDRMRHFRSLWNIAGWSGSGALYGTKRQVAEARRLLKQALRGRVDKLIFLDDRAISLASRFAGLYRLATGVDVKRSLALLQPLYGLLRGIPTGSTLKSCYWRKSGPVPDDPDPDRDGCGVIWFAPISAIDGETAAQIVEIAESTILEYSFEPMISFTLLTERALAAVIAITYDRNVAGEDDKAMLCYRALEERFASAGFYPYRLGISSMDFQKFTPAYRDLLLRIKNALDPNGILAPARYVPLQHTLVER